MSKKLLVTDCDSVLLQWHRGFCKWVAEVYDWHIDPDHPHNTWDFANWFLPDTATGDLLTKEQLVEYIIEFNSSPRVLYPEEHSLEALESISQFKGIDIKVLTSFGSCPVQAKYREEYLQMLFGDIFSEVVVLPLGSCKEEKLKEMKPDWFVEDNKDHADKAAALGIKTFLIDTTYNQGEGDFIRVDNWLDIDDEIYCDIEGVV